MIRSTRSTLALLALAFAVSAFACGGGGGGGSGGSSGTGTGGTSGTGGASGSGGAGAATPLTTSCRAYCKAEDSCNPDTTPTECESYTCPPAGDPNTKENLSATCKTAWIAWWDCLSKQADPCERPGTCTTQAGALAGCAP